MLRMRSVLGFTVGFVIGVILAVITFNRQANLLNEKNVGIRKSAKFSVFKNNIPNLKSIPNLNSTVICVIFTTQFIISFAAAGSWAKHCDKFHFFGKDENDYYKYLNVSFSRPKHSWHFLCDTIRLVDEYFGSSMQWVVFVPDDVFVIPENLRYYVRYLDYNKAYYLGDISYFWGTYYNTGQAGYVLSKGAVKAIVRNFNSTEACLRSGKYWKTEDYYLGKHLADMGIHPKDTRDKKGRGHFHTFIPEFLYFPDGSDGILSKYFTRRVHSIKYGGNCCSDRTITFQGSSQHRIFIYYYLLYHVKPFVRPWESWNNISRVYLPSPEIWEKFIKNELGENTDLTKIDADTYYEIWEKKVSPNELVSRLRAESSDGNLESVMDGKGDP